MKAIKKFSQLILFLTISSFISVSCSSDDSNDNTPDNASLQEIQGAWIRIGGNYPLRNGMKINVNQDYGTVIDAHNSDFLNGDIKWKDIAGQGSGNYSYRDLGIDNTFTSSSMNFNADDTLRISVQGAGTGNIQKWVREANYTPQSVFLAAIQGSWIRVGANQSSNNGVIIDVDDTTGTVTDGAASGFTPGEINWKNIYAVDGSRFIHEELGSDRNYYPATMQLVSDTLRISGNNSGAGNVQKWVRPI